MDILGQGVEGIKVWQLVRPFDTKLEHILTQSHSYCDHIKMHKVSMAKSPWLCNNTQWAQLWWSLVHRKDMFALWMEFQLIEELAQNWFWKETIKYSWNIILVLIGLTVPTTGNLANHVCHCLTYDLSIKYICIYNEPCWAR